MRLATGPVPLSVTYGPYCHGPMLNSSNFLVNLGVDNAVSIFADQSTQFEDVTSPKSPQNKTLSFPRGNRERTSDKSSYMYHVTEVSDERDLPERTTI